MAGERTRFAAKRKRAATIYFHETALDRLARLAGGMVTRWSKYRLQFFAVRRRGSFTFGWRCKIFATFVRRISYHRNSVHEVLNDPGGGPVMATAGATIKEHRTSIPSRAVAKKRDRRCSGNFTLVRRKRAVSLFSRGIGRLPHLPSPHFCSCLRKSRRG